MCADRHSRRHPRRRTRSLVGSVGALAVVVALVGAPAGPAAADHDSAADQQIATAGAVTAADLGAGWTAQPAAASYPAFVAAAAKVSECKPFLAALKNADTHPHAASQQLTNGTQGVHNDVTVFGDTTESGKFLAIYTSNATQRCLAKVVPTLVQTELAKDATLRGNLAKVSLVAAQPQVPSSAGTATQGYQFVLAVDGKDGTSRNYYVDDQLVQLGRAVSRYGFTNLDTPVGAARDAAVAGATARLESALGLSLVAGETTELRDALLPLKGYSYVEPGDEIVQGNAQFLSQPELVEWGCLAGHTDHLVVSGSKTVGVVQLYGYKPECTAEPGFTEAELIADAADFSTDADGNPIGEVTLKDIAGTPVALVTTTGNPDYWATTYMWFDGNVEWMVSTDQPSPAPITEAFVTKIITAQNKD